MPAVIAGWTPEHDRTFKEVLYRFLEEVQSTKAALYLLAPDGTYVLTTQYGFGRRDQLAVAHGPGDPYLDLLRELRTNPRAFNRPAERPEIAGYLEAAGTARLLLVPLAADSRVYGFVDARDKGRRRAFESEDIRRAKAIARTLMTMLGSVGLYPELEIERDPQPREVAFDRVEDHLEAGAEDPVLDEAGLAEVFDAVVRLAATGQLTAALTVIDRSAAASRLVAAGELSESDRMAILRHQSQVLVGEEVSAPDLAAWRVDVRVLPTSRPPDREREIHTAILSQVAGWTALVSFVGLAGGSAAAALDHTTAVARGAQEASALRWNRRRLARRLLAPGERRIPSLEAHAAAVSRLVWSMAHLLGWEASRAEEAALAGLLHDVGLRELDDDLLHHPAPGSEERRLYQHHPVAGERIVSACGLDPVAEAVRHHHERWDGNGYPDRLSGEGTPVLARMVHVAEVWDVLTASHSYRRSVPAERAMAILRAAAGHQFDPRMVDVLARAVT